MSKEIQKIQSGRASAPCSSLPADITVAAMQGLPNGLFLFDTQRRLVFANTKAKQVHVTLQLGASCCEMFWPAENGSCVVDRALDTDTRLEFEMTAKGSPILVSVEPLKSEDRTESYGALVVARDIATLRRAEAEVIAQKSFLANVADRSPDEIFALDKQGRITWVNR